MQLPEIAKNFERLIISSTIAVAAPIPQGTSVRAGDDGRINFTSNCYQAILLSSFLTDGSIQSGVADKEAGIMQPLFLTQPG
jgi:hypothetical protein